MAPTETVAPPIPVVRVVVVKPLVEEFKKYSVDDVLEVPLARAQQLEGLGLVATIPEGAPRRGLKLQAAREAAGTLHNEAISRSREEAAIRKEIEGAESKVGALQASVNAATGLDAVRSTQDALAEAQRSLSAQRALLENVARRAREASSKAQAARKTLEDLEARAAWLRDKGIPGQEENVAAHHRAHQQKVRDAEVYLAHSVRPAEEALSKLQGELQLLEG